MDTIQLKKELDKLGVPRILYSINNKRDDRICLQFLDDSWVVFYVERGMEKLLKKTQSESDACEFMLNELRHEI